VTKEQLKAIEKAERDRRRDSRRTLNMLEKLEIDKIKLPQELISANK
jgi:hypothetical protein